MARSIGFVPKPKTDKKLGVIIYGVGAIGVPLVKYVLETGLYDIVGAVDVDPAKVGRNLGEIAGAGSAGPEVVDSLAKAPRGADVVIHMAGSRLPSIESQLTSILESGFHCVSSSEELCFPRLRYPEIADRLDGVARSRNVTCIAAGVNPGFVMDVLPVVSSTVSVSVEHVSVQRVVDAATRREPLQRKVGAGMTREAFEALAVDEKIGHVGLIESCAFIAQGMGLAVDTIQEDLRPKMAEQPIKTQFLEVAPGQVAGIHHRAEGKRGEECLIELDLQMYVGAPDPRDEVIVRGRPEMHVLIPGGTAGDFATVSALLNMCPRAVAARPGLLTALDAPLGA